MSQSIQIPNHIAIIMDGNGRWAKKQGQDRTFGHQNGVEAVREAIKGCREKGVKFLTLYAFSSENWNRPKDEVDFLMGLLVEAIKNETPELLKNGIKLESIGDISQLPNESYKSLLEAKAATAHNTELTLILALNYGGQNEIIQAANALIEDSKNGNLPYFPIDNALFQSKLYTAAFPNPDLLIRTSMELRISNFLLFQLAYSEFFFLDIFWPEFTRQHLFDCIEKFKNRERRYGKTSEQL
jgi:undecaprenyl diphosphate synthase